MKTINILFLIFFFSSNCIAAPAIYTIEDRVQAVFPDQPLFKGETDMFGQKWRRYTFIDAKNAMGYTLAIQVNKVTISKADINKELVDFITGLALTLNGTVTRQDVSGHNDDNGAHFTIEYQQQETSMRINGLVIYRDGHFYEWFILDLPFKSKLDGLNVRNSYAKYFKVK